MFSQACVKNSVHRWGGLYPSMHWGRHPSHPVPSACWDINPPAQCMLGNTPSGRHPHPVFLLTLVHWPMASKHCWSTSDFLSYLLGLASGISTIVKSQKGKLNWFLQNQSICSHVCLNKESLIIRGLNLIIH